MVTTIKEWIVEYIKKGYVGVYTYGATQKAYGRELRRVRRSTKREKGQVRRAPGDVLRIPMAELRIIDETTALRVQERLSDRRERYLAAVKVKGGKHPFKASGKYLMSGGLLVCPDCGGLRGPQVSVARPARRHLYLFDAPQEARRLQEHVGAAHRGNRRERPRHDRRGGPRDGGHQPAAGSGGRRGRRHGTATG